MYCHPDIPSRKFIRYCGDETVVTQFPHGNSKWKAKLTTPYVRTNPDLFDEIRKKDGAPSTIFRKLLTEGPTDLIRHLVDAPRDIEQVSNILKKSKKWSLLSWRVLQHHRLESWSKGIYIGCSPTWLFLVTMTLCSLSFVQFWGEKIYQIIY